MTYGGIIIMDILEVSPKEYQQIIGAEVPVFIRSEFLELNSDKVDMIHYLIGKDSKQRFAFAIGEKEKEWKAPFSAPFSNIVFLKKDISMDQLYAFVSGLNSFAVKHKAKSVNIFLPANIYGEQQNSKMVNALLGNGYRILFEDINYSFDLDAISIDTYPDSISHMGRKNLRIGLDSDLRLERCESKQEEEDAYDIIKINRESRGFPLRMTKQQVMDTISIVDHDLFLIKKEDRMIASAVVYHVTRDIAQVVYWGNIPDVGNYKPINYMAYMLIRYYKNMGFRILDIGPSTEEGIPNFGLCTFKESIGCISSAKTRLQIDFE